MPRPRAGRPVSSIPPGVAARGALRLDASGKPSPSGSSGVIAAASAALLWGFSAALAKRFFSDEEPVPVETVTAGRTLVAALCMAGWASLYRPGSWHVSLRDRASFLVTGMFLGLTSYTYYRAIESAGVSVGILLQYVSPFLVFLWVAWKSPRAIDARSWCALGLILAGVFLLCWFPRAAAAGEYSRTPPPPSGVAWGLASACLFAAFTLRARGAMERSSYSSFTLHAFLGAAVTGTTILAARQLLSPIPDPGPVTSQGALLSATIGVLGTVVPFSLYLMAVERIGPARAAAASTLEPVFGGLAAFLLTGEVPTALQAAGGAAIVLAVILLEWRRAAPATPPAAS